MYKTFIKLTLMAAILLMLSSSWALAQGPCTNECNIRASFGNRLVKGPADESKKALDLFTSLTQSNVMTCRNACVNETTPAGCKACAKKTLTDQKLAEDKSKLAAFDCPKPAPKDVPCVAVQQPKITYDTRSPAQKDQDIIQRKRDYARRASDDLAKKAADMEPKIQELYKEGMEAKDENVKKAKLAEAEKLAMEAFNYKVQEANMRPFAEGKPHDPGRNFCLPACNSRLPPFNGMKLSADNGLYNKAMVEIPILAKKLVLECVRACAVKSNAECGACALDQVSPEVQKNLTDYFTSNYGCGVMPETPPPTGGQIAGEVILGIIGVGGVGSCPIVNFPGVNMSFPAGVPDPATLIRVN